MTVPNLTLCDILAPVTSIAGKLMVCIIRLFISRNEQATMRTNPRANLSIYVLTATLIGVGAIPGLMRLGAAQVFDAKGYESIETRLRRLEDCEEIRQLLVDYGRTLDQRNFAGFSKLFAYNAEYTGGGGTAVTKGPAAIARLLEDTFRKNPTGVGSPNFHIFANESIRVRGDEAVAVSKGMFVVPGLSNRPEVIMLATYNNVLTRENGRWKFKRRVVHGDIPAPKTKQGE